MSDYIKREDAVFIVLQQPMLNNSVVVELRQLDGIDIVRCKECKKSHIDGKTTHCPRCGAKMGEE